MALHVCEAHLHSLLIQVCHGQKATRARCAGRDVAACVGAPSEATEYLCLMCWKRCVSVCRSASVPVLDVLEEMWQRVQECRQERLSWHKGVAASSDGVRRGLRRLNADAMPHLMAQTTMRHKNASTN